MTREEKIDLLDKLLEIEEKNDIGNLTMAERGEFQQWVETLKQESAIDKIRGEIADYGSIWVTYAITGRKDSDIEQLIKGVLKQAKEQVLDIIDKYKAENNL